MLHWHLSGLSELPLKTTPSITCRRVFDFFILCFRRAIFFQLCAFVGILLYHVGACCRKPSTCCSAVPQEQRRTAQHNAISPRKAEKQVRAYQSATTQAGRQRAPPIALHYRKHSTGQHSTAQLNHAAQCHKASTCRSEIENASKQTELARVSICRRAFIQQAEFSKRTKKKIKTCRGYKNVKLVTQRWCNAGRIRLQFRSH